MTKPATAATAEKKLYQYDPVALAAMTPPLTIRVERIRGTNRTPINVPSPGGEGYNTGFDAAQLEGLEAWLRDRGAGGGLYSVTVYDQQNAKFEWRPWFDPRLHREIVPGDSTNVLLEQPQAQQAQQPPLVMMTPSGPVMVQAPQPPPQPTLQQPQTFAALPWPPPQSPFSAQPQPQQVPVSIPYNPYSFMQPVPAPSAVPSGGASEYERRAQAESLERMKNELAEAKRKALEDAYNARAERQAADFQRQVEDLKRAQAAAPAVDPAVAELKALVAQLLQKPAGPDPAVAELKEQLRRSEERAERERERNELKEALRRTEDSTAAQIAALTAQFAAAAVNKGPDPMLEFAKENARNQLEMVRDINRSQQLQAEAYRSLMKDSSSGVDVATKSMLGNFGAMFDMQQRLVDYAMQATSSSEGPIVSTIKEGINAAKDYGERYAINKRQEAQAAAAAQQATAEAARAQAVERTVQMEMMARREAELAEQEQAQREGRRTQGQVNREAGAHRGAFTPDAPPAQPGLSGAPVAAAPAAAAVNEHGQTVPAPTQVKRKGKTDAEWFGDAMVEVDRLRFGAAMFSESAEMEPPRLDKKTGQILGLTPPQTVEYLLRAVDIVVKNQMDIPAFRVLFMQEAYADFFDVLLPNVPQIYRDDCAQALFAHMRSGAGHAITNAAPIGSDAAAAADAAGVDEGGEDEGGEDDGADDGDDDVDGKPHANGAAPQPPQAPPPTVVKPGIARRVTRAS